MQLKKIISYFFIYIVFTSLINIVQAKASTPTWTFTPLTNTTITVPSNGQKSIVYRVTNNSPFGKRLVIKHMDGVTQASICIAAGKGKGDNTCQLSLNIDGSKLPNNGLKSGPVLCQANSKDKPDNNACYQPSTNQQVNITKGDEAFFTIGGNISNLSTSGLVLQNNAGDDLSVASGAASFQFQAPIPFGDNYNVTVAQQPTGQTCTVSNGSGSNIIGNINNISISCSVNTFTIGGDVAGLSASGLVLQNNGADDLSIASGATSFMFATPVAYDGSYNVTVLQQPVGQTCTVSNGSSSNVTGNISSVGITCSVNSFTIGGNIANLVSDGLVLRNNGSDDLSISAGSTSFTFAAHVAYGGSYNVTVQQQPVGQSCVVSNGSDTNVTANVTNVYLTCTNISILLSSASPVGSAYPSLISSDGTRVIYYEANSAGYDQVYAILII